MLVNNVADESEARKAFSRLQRSVVRFLNVQLKYLGYVPSDRAVPEAVRSQRALLELYPSSPAGLALAGIARRIDESFWDYRIKGGVQFFFRQLLELNAYGG